MKQSDFSKTDEFRKLVFSDILHGNYNPGDKLPTEREMAESCGISRITVRRAYSELETAGILERRRGSGTFVANRTRANNDPGNITALLMSVGSPFSLDFIRAMEKEITAHGGLLVLRLTDDSPELEETAAIDVVGNGIRNLVIWPSGDDFRSETFARLRVLGANMVFFDRMFPGEYADYVGVDNNHAMQVLFESAGAMDAPLFVTYSDKCFDSSFARENAFRRECRKRGINGSVIRLPMEGGKIGSDVLPEGNDAIFTVNDDMAVRLLETAGSRPVFSIDGHCRRIVSYRQPMHQMAEKVVQLLYKQRNGSTQWYPERIFVKGEKSEKIQ